MNPKKSHHSWYSQTSILGQNATAWAPEESESRLSAGPSVDRGIHCHTPGSWNWIATPVRDSGDVLNSKMERLENSNSKKDRKNDGLENMYRNL